MRKGRIIGGIILICIGVLIMGLTSLGGVDLMFTFSIYSIPLIVIGIIIILNKNADKIEQINYSKVKRRK